MLNEQKAENIIKSILNSRINNDKDEPNLTFNKQDTEREIDYWKRKVIFNKSMNLNIEIIDFQMKYNRDIEKLTQDYENQLKDLELEIERFKALNKSSHYSKSTESVPLYINQNTSLTNQIEYKNNNTDFYPQYFYYPHVWPQTYYGYYQPPYNK